MGDPPLEVQYFVWPITAHIRATLAHYCSLSCCNPLGLVYIYAIPMENLMAYLDNSFGVEIECYLPEGGSQQQVAAAVRHRLGALGGCNVESYNHHVASAWKVVTDGSLNDYSRGIELVSPVLVGEAGLKQIEVVCKALADFGCTISKRCGLHVHVGVGHAVSVDFFKNLVKLYSAYEPVIDTLMPPSRRANINTYCRSMASVSASAIDAAPTFHAVLGVATASRADSHNAPRYFKLNLAAYLKYRTVEFRQHSGTLDGMKARNWTVLCLRMVEAAKGNLSALGTAPAQNKARPGSKAHKIGEMLLRSQGVTGREICTEMGWPSVSIPAQAKAAGIAVTAQRMGREVRYFAVNNAAAPASAPITIDGLASLIGASDDEKDWMRQRIADLSSPVSVAL